MRSTSFWPTSRRRGAARQQMFGAVDLRRFRQDRGAAVAHQNIDGRAERGIGGDAGIAVRAAALQRQHQFARRHRLAPRAIDDRQHGRDALDARVDRLARAAGRLDGHRLEQLALAEAVFLLHAADLEHFAAEPDQHHAGDIGIAGIAPLRALENVEAFALGRHAAAGAVNERDDAVDIGIIVEHAGALEFAGDQPRDGRRTIHAGQDRQIIARARLAVGAAIALERRLLATAAG